MRCCLGIYALILICFSDLSLAKDFGKYGDTTEIAEQDLLVYITKKLQIVGSQALEKHQEKIKDKMVASCTVPLCDG